MGGDLRRLSPPAPRGWTLGPPIQQAAYHPTPTPSPAQQARRNPGPADGQAQQTHPTAWPEAAVPGATRRLTSAWGKKPPGERHKGLQSRPAWREAHSQPGASEERGLQAQEQGHCSQGLKITCGFPNLYEKLRHGLDSEFSTPGPPGPWTRPPKSAPRSPPCRAEVGGEVVGLQAHPRLTPDKAVQPRLRGLESCMLGRPPPGAQTLLLCVSLALPWRMGRKGPPAARSPAKPPGRPPGNSRITGAFSSALCPRPHSCSDAS